ncbi:MAG: T9SS type A sorting domain-containing protein [Kaistella sp.]
MRLYLSLIIFSAVFANAQTEVKWKKVFDGSQGDSFANQVKTTDSNFVFSGSTSSSDGDLPVNYGSSDVVVSKITKDGNILWTKVIGGNNSDTPSDMIKTSDGGVILTVLSRSNTDFFPQHYGGTTNNDVYVIKLNADGDILWNKFIGGSGDESNATVVSTNTGYVVAINSLSNDFDFESPYGGKNILLIKFDEMGDVIWKKILAGSNDEVFEDIKSFDNVNTVLAINSNSIDGSFSNSSTTIKKGFLIKINAEGDLVFSTPIITDNPNLDNSVSKINFFNNQYFAVGTERKESFQAVGTIRHYDAMLVNFSESGSLLWKKNYSWKVNTPNNSETYYDGALFIEQTIDNHILLSGVTYLHEDSMYGINLISSWLKKIDMQGNLVKTIGRKSRTYKLEKLPNGLFIDHAYKYENGPYGINSIYDLQIVSPDGMNFLPSTSFKSVLTTDINLGTRTGTSTVDDNNLILFSNRHNLTESSIWITRIQSSEFTTTELASEEVEAPKVAIYPNPTSNFIKLTKRANKISLYDTAGKLLIMAKDTNVIDLTKFLKGVYFLNIEIDNKSKSFKVIKN